MVTAWTLHTSATTFEQRKMLEEMQMTRADRKTARHSSEQGNRGEREGGRSGHMWCRASVIKKPAVKEIQFSGE